MVAAHHFVIDGRRFDGDALRGAIESASVSDEVLGSDHCPVGLDLAL